MTSLDIDDTSDDDPRPRRRRDESWLRQNWLSVAMFAAFIVSQAYGGGSWIWSRTSAEQDLKLKIERLEIATMTAATTYVRQDVFVVVMKSIDDRLASIDKKVSERR